ncbi:MAG: aldehyde dehydrogenase [Candidatus Rokuibacteriota bacterium]|nr:MAG: aldehyde dehydrogenase [Candidatus Rokubacteria bacterium]
MPATLGAVAAGEVHSIDPATLEPVASVATASSAEVGAAVAEAQEAQARWRRSSSGERRARLQSLGDVILAHAEEIATSVTSETGKPIVESFTTELYPALESVHWLASNVDRVLRPERLPMTQLLLKHKRGYLVYEPLGVVAVISPWNFPFAIPFTQAVAAVAARNGVVLKPAEWTPLSGAWVERLFSEAGFPSGLVRVVQGEGPTVGAELARTAGVARVIFTGSAEVGRAVAAAAAELLRPVTLELGGKDPMLVFEDCDPGRAVSAALWGSFANCGQVCSGVERIYVERPVFERFIAALARRAESLRIGHGSDPATDLGPLIREEQRLRVEELVCDALEHGAQVASGGGRARVSLPGWFHEPTVLVGERIGGRIQEEEVFGPVVTVEPFSGEQEAIALANGSRFGLGASIWTRNTERTRRVGGRLEAGSVWTNDVAYSYYAAQAPWGGCKGSGFGRTHGRHGLYELSQVRFVDRDVGHVPVPWWFPYGDAALDGFKGAMKLLYGAGARNRAGQAWNSRHGLAHLGRRYLGRA